jgi:hypothetical protein
MSKSTKNIKQGGAREGAGRPKIKEDTVVMRIPISLVEQVKQLIVNSNSQILGTDARALDAG